MNKIEKLAAARPTDMERYLFDLNGFLILKGALSPQQVAACNKTYDKIQNFKGRGWLDGMHVVSEGRQDGIMVQQLYEAGGVWEELIDHPAWFEKVRHFIGTDDPENFDGYLGPMFIDECFGSIREKGDAMRVHSGGQVGTIRTQFRFHAGNFHCGQVNILIALTDIGTGDGATMVVPASHKSNIRHPDTVPVEQRGEMGLSTDDVRGAVEVHLKAGDALLFVDALMHGSARRTNDGQRRICVYRYGPSWANFRHNFTPSDELLERLSEQRRKIVMPKYKKPQLTG